MDLPVDWGQEVIKNNLPPELLLFVNTHILDPSSPFQAFLRHSTVVFSAATARLLPFIGILIDHFTNLVGENPNIFSGVVIIVLAYVTIQIISFAKRVMLFWTRLAMRLLLWAWVALFISVMMQRGFTTSVTEIVGWVWSVYGMISKVVAIWVREYQAVRAQQERAEAGGHRHLDFDYEGQEERSAWWRNQY
ncbi:hypothetical protein QBC38DRAFT_468730 [Podospora fimiseda]|uniref:Uncharacterized protein n=1 Tax=Podospora fimiseda TaxID=252190 RepID=A0AAN7BWD4_9PEZI|nr:hypothetical protein QBC38DRAFT_468730 [Podospora fimiseda]